MCAWIQLLEGSSRQVGTEVAGLSGSLLRVEVFAKKRRYVQKDTYKMPDGTMLNVMDDSVPVPAPCVLAPTLSARDGVISVPFAPKRMDLGWSTISETNAKHHLESKVARPHTADSHDGAIQAGAARHGAISPLDGQIRNPTHDKLNDLRDQLLALMRPSSTAWQSLGTCALTFHRLQRVDLQYAL